MQTLALLALLVIAAGIIGKTESAINFSVSSDWRRLFATAIIAIVIPSLGEELVFRVGLAGRRGWLRATGALALFILWHPLQLWLGLPMAQPVFAEPGFLAIVALLGLACTLAYRWSGSLWPPVFIHWTVVVGWKAVAGG